MARVPEVLVVDQDQQGRFEIKQLIRQGQLGFAGEAGFGTEAVSAASEIKPDIIFCGISAPPERSLQTIEALLDVLPETPIIAYASREDVEVVRQTMLAGARDFLIVPAPLDRLLDSVRAVLESEERKRLRLSGQAKGIGPKGLVMAVFGAKGGVGKTTVATNVGVALASTLGQSTVLVDADNSFGDVAALLEIRVDRSVADLAKDAEKIDRGNVTDYLTRHSSGLWVLPAPADCLLWRSVAPERFRMVIDLLARRFDIVLIDTAAALSDLSLAALEEANLVLWVTSSDFSSISNSLAGLDALQKMSYPESRIRLVLNVNSSDDGLRPAKIEEALKRQFFWSIPYDRLVRTGGQIGSPAVASAPDTAGAKALTRLAVAVTGGKADSEPAPKERRGWFRRRDEAAGEPESTPVAQGG